MGSSKVVLRSVINRSLEDVVKWHLQPLMEERSIPPWEGTKLLSISGTPEESGARFTFKSHIIGPIWVKLHLEYRNYIPGESFEVHQVKGPFKEWTYKMKGRPQGEHTCEIIDQFTFKSSFLTVSMPCFTHLFEKRFMGIIKYKHELLQNDLYMADKYPYEKPLKILVTGSHGFVGTALVQFLEFMGHDVWTLSRKSNPKDEKNIYLDDSSKLEGFDAVYHLAGENIGEGKWTGKKMEAIYKSRVEGTQELVKTLSALKSPPKTLICASAVGYFGNRGEETLNEESSVGTGSFLAQVCQDWEQATQGFLETGGRVVNARFGMILNPNGGALKQMLVPFRIGLGGRLGDGSQYISWISMDDLIGALYHVLMTPELKGAVNCTSPYPVTNSLFTEKLIKGLRRWQGPPIPAFVLRVLFGQKADELLLASTKAVPAKLLDTNFTFHFPKLSQAFEHLLPPRH